MTEEGESREVARLPMKGRILDAKSITRVGTWNVRAMYQCGTMAQLLRELTNYHLSILGISEMRWTGSGKINSEGKTLLYSGHNKQHVRGVGFVLNVAAAKSLIGWKPVNDRIITVRFQTRFAKTTVHTGVRTNWWHRRRREGRVLRTATGRRQRNTKSRRDIKLIMGDWNAQLDADRSGVEQVKGPHGTGNCTADNGDRFLLFCNINCLSIGNTFFAHKTIHKKTWRSPDGNTKNEIDYTCVSQWWRSALQDVRVYRGADVGSDHHLLTAAMRIRLKKMNREKMDKPYAVEKLNDAAVVEKYQLEINKRLLPQRVPLPIATANRFQPLQDQTAALEEEWATFKQAVQESAESAIGWKRGAWKERWITPETWKLIDKRKDVKRQRDQANEEENQRTAEERYRVADRQVKNSCKKDKRNWIEGKIGEAQEAANRNDTRTLYRIIRDLTGSKSGGNAPVKDKNGKILVSEEEQNRRWMEHFKETLNQVEPTETFKWQDLENARDQLHLWTKVWNITFCSKNFSYSDQQLKR